MHSTYNGEQVLEIVDESTINNVSKRMSTRTLERLEAKLNGQKYPNFNSWEFRYEAHKHFINARANDAISK